MERNEEAKRVSLGQRLALSLKVLLNATFAAEVVDKEEQKQVAPDPEKEHASGLLLLGALQREGRLLDFLQQDVASFSDEQVGAAARVVHGGCRKILQQYFDFEPASKEEEGAEINLAKGFDRQRWRLTGNIAGQPPYRGTLRHHGWIARQVRMPLVADGLDLRVVAPAEVELP